jgi:hypothetical protein
VDQRLRRLHDLGFDAAELELVTTVDGTRLRLVPRVVEHGFHTQKLRSLTGIEAGENQARRLLNDISRYRAVLEQRGGRKVVEAVAAARWLDERFERCAGRDSRRDGRQARTRRAVPPGARTPLVPVRARRRRRGHRRRPCVVRGRRAGFGPDRTGGSRPTRRRTLGAAGPAQAAASKAACTCAAASGAARSARRAACADCSAARRRLVDGGPLHQAVPEAPMSSLAGHGAAVGGAERARPRTRRDTAAATTRGSPRRCGCAR